MMGNHQINTCVMKNILDRYIDDLAFNLRNPIFAPYDDLEMGKRIDGGFVAIRKTQYGLCEEYVFDNGHRYGLFHDTNIIREGDTIHDDYFIHKFIEKCIYDIIVNNSECKTPVIYCTPNEVEVIADSNPILMFRAVVDRVNKIVSVTNIFVYKRYCGYGKQLLKTIFYRCEDLGYRLFLTEMVPVFYSRMKERGATIIEYGNIVEITDKTNLD